MNLDEVKLKNEFEIRKKILMQYRKSCERRTQDFDYLRYGKRIDSLNSSKNPSRTEMEISLNNSKDLNNTSREEIKKDFFRMPENPKKTENIITDTSSIVNSTVKHDTTEIEILEKPINSSFTPKEGITLNKESYFNKIKNFSGNYNISEKEKGI